MTFGEEIPEVGQVIRIKWGEGEWIDYGALLSIKDAGSTPNVTWLLSSYRYQNSVVRYYDQWEIKP